MFIIARKPNQSSCLNQNLNHAFFRKAFSNEERTESSTPERWYDPEILSQKSRIYVEQPAGKGYLHPVSIKQINDYLSQLPQHLIGQIDQAVKVISLSGRTSKNSRRYR